MSTNENQESMDYHKLRDAFDEYQAVFFNPIHGDFNNNMKLWAFEPHGETISDGTKCGCMSGTTLKEIPIPEMTAGQRVEIAIRCVMVVYKDDKWLSWAERWLSGEDRTKISAYAAHAAAEAEGVDVIAIIHSVVGRKE